MNEVLRPQGHVAPGWEPVADVFAAHIQDGRDAGAAVAVHHRGRAVIDLWAGWADETADRPWERETVALTFSCAKGVSTLCVLMMVERGLLDLDAPIAAYWPEFAAEGKADAPVRWLLTHQVGLPYVDSDLSPDDLLAERPVVDALAAQKPFWEPGEAFAYHGLSFGPLLGEVVRRATGRTLGDWFRDEVAEPLGLRSWIGYPASQPEPARIVSPGPDLMSMLPAEHPIVRTLTLSGALPLRFLSGNDGRPHDRAVLALGLGGSHLVTDARSLSRVYAAAAGHVDGIRLLPAPSVVEAARPRTLDIPMFGASADEDAHGVDFATGFMVRDELLGDTSFGHPGASGSLGFGDLEHEIGFGYVTSTMAGPVGDTRAVDLVESVRRCLA